MESLQLKVAANRKTLKAANELLLIGNCRDGLQCLEYGQVGGERCGRREPLCDMEPVFAKVPLFIERLAYQIAAKVNEADRIARDCFAALSKDEGFI
uniref:Uncharacterized protein n=1 Tax=Parascaris univalens TaxID=6257 RepID=A0A914ZWL7_PARUN